ncbi:unnamed protein product, partial [Ectocarpus sp. 12 AP-2014]
VNPDKATNILLKLVFGSVWLGGLSSPNTSAARVCRVSYTPRLAVSFSNSLVHLVSPLLDTLPCSRESTTPHTHTPGHPQHRQLQPHRTFTQYRLESGVCISSTRTMFPSASLPS